MGWFWDRNPPPPSSVQENDPLRNLDPSLREFLEKESPVKYKPAPAPPSSSPSTTRPSLASPTSQTNPSPPVVPKESLYQDGRYAYLWKNYRPQSEIEAEGKSEQEKLSDVLEGYKERKAQIGRAAAENCAFEQAAVDECYERGSYTDKLFMCRTESRAFDRCYNMQSRFLKALGFLSTYDRPASVDEEIQMHADTLFHRLLDQERAIEAAKTAGEPAPTFPPILAPAADKTPRGFRDATIQAATAAPATPPPPPLQQTPALTPAEANMAAVAAAKKAKEDKELPPLNPEIEKKLKPDAARALRKRMRGMDPLEREIEERATVVEIEDAARTGQQIENLRDEARQRRKEAGLGRGELGDWIVKWFGGPGHK